MSETRTPLSVAMAFAAALLAAPAVSSAASRDASPSALPDEALADHIRPSAAALQRLETVITQQTQMRRMPGFVDLWPEVTHVEAIRRP